MSTNEWMHWRRPSADVRLRDVLSKILGAVAIVMGLVGLMSGVGSEPHGVGTVTRSLMGLAGITGGIFVFMGRSAWFPILMTWAVLQIPVIIVDPSGPLTNQGCHLGFVQSHQTSFNGVTTSQTGFGVNGAGAILAVLAFAARRTAVTESDGA